MQIHEEDEGERWMCKDRAFSSDLEIGSNYVVLSGVERSLRYWEHREKRAEVLNSI